MPDFSFPRSTYPNAAAAFTKVTSSAEDEVYAPLGFNSPSTSPRSSISFLFFKDSSGVFTSLSLTSISLEGAFDDSSCDLSPGAWSGVVLLSLYMFTTLWAEGCAAASLSSALGSGGMRWSSRVVLVGFSSREGTRWCGEGGSLGAGVNVEEGEGLGVDLDEDRGNLLPLDCEESFDDTFGDSLSSTPGADSTLGGDFESVENGETDPIAVEGAFEVSMMTA